MFFMDFATGMVPTYAELQEQVAQLEAERDDANKVIEARKKAFDIIFNAFSEGGSLISPVAVLASGHWEELCKERIEADNVYYVHRDKYPAALSEQEEKNHYCRRCRWFGYLERDYECHCPHSPYLYNTILNDHPVNTGEGCNFREPPTSEQKDEE